ncbi:MAG: hypothetical protein C4321_02160, partial [Chloroflexota bacterium]
MEDHPGDGAASGRGRHHERAGGELGVVVRSDREADETAAGEVLDGLAHVEAHLLAPHGDR